MFGAIKRLLLFMAWGILFAHSVIPHAHEIDAELTVCTTSHEHDADLLDALSHIFHFSTGEDHLEDYNAGSGQLHVILPEAQKSLTQVAEDKGQIVPIQQEVQKSRYRSRSLRAPPAYS